MVTNDIPPEPPTGESSSDTAPWPGLRDGDAPASIPTSIGPYRILSVLGEGGMGTVYRALQEQPVRREVAIKLIKLGMGSREVVARFDLERRALAAMNHGSIAKIFDAGATEAGQPYFVMELVDGLPLTRYCDEFGLDLRERIALFQQICTGVQHAHQKGIIHRDLKPGNVLVVREGDRAVPKILDFGLAKATNREEFAQTLFTAREAVMGTPEYMAPEQAAADTELIDTRADVYSLGVLLYELLCGALPFATDELRGAGWARIGEVLRDVEPPKPSVRAASEISTGPSDRAERQRRTTLVRELRGDLDWIVMMAIAKEPDRRYDSANALSMDLSRYLGHEPVLAGPPSVGYRVGKFVRRYRLQVVAAATVLVATMVSAVVSLVFYVDAVANAERAVQRGDLAQRVLENLVYTVQDEMATVPDPRARTARLNVLAQARTGYEELRDALRDAPEPSERAVRAAIEIARLSADLSDPDRGATAALEAVGLAEEFVRAEPESLVSRLCLVDALYRRALTTADRAEDVVLAELDRLQAELTRLAEIATERGDVTCLARVRRLEIDALAHGGRVRALMNDASGLDQIEDALERARRHDTDAGRSAAVDEPLLLECLIAAGVAATRLTQYERARRFLADAQALGERLLGERPGEPALLFLLGRVHERLAVTWHEVSPSAGHTARAAEEVERAIELFERASALEPHRTATAVALADALIKHAAVVYRSRAFDRATADVERALELLGAAESQGVTGLRSRFGNAELKLADTVLQRAWADRSGTPEAREARLLEAEAQALRHRDRAIAHYRRNREDEPSAVADIGLAKALTVSVGRVLPYDAGIARFAEAEALYAGLTHPPRWLVGLLLFSRAGWHEDGGQPEQAAEYYRRFVPLAREELEKRPNDGYLRWQLQTAEQKSNLGK